MTLKADTRSLLAYTNKTPCCSDCSRQQLVGVFSRSKTNVGRTDRVSTTPRRLIAKKLSSGSLGLDEYMTTPRSHFAGPKRGAGVLQSNR